MKCKRKNHSKIKGLDFWKKRKTDEGTQMSTDRGRICSIREGERKSRENERKREEERTGKKQGTKKGKTEG